MIVDATLPSQYIDKSKKKLYMLSDCVVFFLDKRLQSQTSNTYSVFSFNK